MTQSLESQAFPQTITYQLTRSQLIRKETPYPNKFTLNICELLIFIFMTGLGAEQSEMPAPVSHLWLTVNVDRSATHNLYNV